jgi:hypothetical protein
MPPLARLTADTIPALEQIRPLAGCTENVLVPFGELRVPDERFKPTGPIFEEAGKFLPGLAGESRSFDANGMWYKVLGQGGAETFDLGNGIFGSALQPVAGVNPPPDRTLPPYRPDVPCETQSIPDLRTRPGAPPQAARRATTPALRQQVAERTRKAQAAYRAVQRAQRKVRRGR